MRESALTEAGIAASQNDVTRMPADWYDSQHIDPDEASAAAVRDSDYRQTLSVMRRKGMA